MTPSSAPCTVVSTASVPSLALRFFWRESAQEADSPLRELELLFKGLVELLPPAQGQTGQ